MSKKVIVPVEGRDYTRLPNGVIRVARHMCNLEEPYREEPTHDYLGLVDHSLKVKKSEYDEILEKAEKEFNKLVRKMPEQKRFLIVVLQGRDGAGKTGASMRIFAAVYYDASIFMAVPIKGPTEDERAHSWLWRFNISERMPKYGQVRVFDRSWYERVLVEPVMKLTPRERINESYADLRLFDRLLQRQGAVLVKIWMDITKDEQAERFEDRAKEKPEKLGEADRVAREHWDDYTLAANEMFRRTGTDSAPWHIISSENKRYSRCTVLHVINDVMRESLS